MLFPYALAFLLGIVALQFFSVLPSVLYAYMIFFLAVGVRYRRWLRLPLVFALGFAWALVYATAVLSWQLPKSWEQQPLIISGYISSIPKHSPRQSSFLFRVQSIESRPVKTIVQLTWANCPIHLRAGDSWRLKVRLKRVHGLSNPGGFDYEAQALLQGVRATGVLVAHAQPIRLTSHAYHAAINRWRQSIKEKLETNLEEDKVSHWLIALAVGERNDIPQDQWTVLRNTGTNHLMAIAGLHIGLMSGFSATLVMSLWRRQKKWLLYLPTAHAGAYAALIVAIFYSAMAGFSIPTQRAVLMMSIFLLVLLQRRHIAAGQAWSLAMIIVLVMNPLDVLSQSFWLSFGTIALIIYGMRNRVRPKGLWWKWGRTQWLIGLGLVPLSLLFFQECSLISFLANSIAIPWLGFLILPFCFIGSLLLWLVPSLGKGLLYFAHLNMVWLWRLLEWLSGLPWATWHHAISFSAFIPLSLGIVWLLMPRPFPGRYLGLVGFLPLFFGPAKSLANGDMLFTILDVGQGLAAVIQTQQHVLIYDTGPKIGSWDMGENVVIPFLRSSHVDKIDLLVVSHGDNDHSGGAPSISQAFPVWNIKTSVPEKFTAANMSHCLQGQAWDWDGVHFSFIYPGPADLHLGNNSSCVLRVESGKHVILLTGDVEQSAEERMVISSSQDLRAEILVAPHHGSKTSAREDFVAAVAPKYVIYAVGYRNRFHFPHQSVVQAYQRLQAQQLDTASLGAIEFQINAHTELTPPRSYRREHLHYW